MQAALAALNDSARLHFSAHGLAEALQLWTQQQSFLVQAEDQAHVHAVTNNASSAAEMPASADAGLHRSAISTEDSPASHVLLLGSCAGALGMGAVASGAGVVTCVERCPQMHHMTHKVRWALGAIAAGTRILLDHGLGWG